VRPQNSQGGEAPGVDKKKAICPKKNHTRPPKNWQTPIKLTRGTDFQGGNQGEKEKGEI